MPNTIAYDWSQTATHLSLHLRIPSLKADLKQQQQCPTLSITLASCYLRVCRHPWILELDLWGDVDYKSAKVTPGTDSLSIMVPKLHEGFWGSVSAVSNPALQQHEIRERRRIAVAAYTEWQEQQQQKRSAARHTRKEEQQRRVWKQRKEQREWHEHQKAMQARHVLEQLQDDVATTCGRSSECSTAEGASLYAHHRVEKPTSCQKYTEADVSHEMSSSSMKKQLHAYHAQRIENSRSGCEWTDHKNQPPPATKYDADSSEINNNESTESVQNVETPNVLCEAFIRCPPEQPTSHTGRTETVDNSACVAEDHGRPASCTTVSVSFGARRPNRIPARGPREPPLPNSTAVISNSTMCREKPGDLPRLQQTSPEWLHSKATRLLLGGDPAAAAEAYGITLRLKGPHTYQPLVVAKAFCGRSLAWLAMGENEKLFPEKDRSTADDGEFSESCCGAANRDAVAADLLHVQRLRQIQKKKQDADTALRLALKCHQKQAVQHFDSSLSKEEDLVQGCVAPTAGTEVAQQSHRTYFLLQRSIRLYVHLLTHLVAPESSSADSVHGGVAVRDIHVPSQSTTGYGCAKTLEDPGLLTSSTTAITSTPASVTLGCIADVPIGDIVDADAAAATEAAKRLAAALLTTVAHKGSFPCAAAAAAVLSNMALALLHLQVSSCASAAVAAADAAGTLIRHAEERLNLQQIHVQGVIPPLKEEKQHLLKLCQQENDRQLHTTVQVQHCLPNILGTLHQVPSAD
ncbi:hypothetical protein cyc_04444 [Cyclospora cayetanensis]|uniref:CS domain-containing protein n=1 Tax=Cyclospora cayetanensis TaxID=88456 RepID=A0A1D3CR82_9EIME|nr:hypothetical protein cyc_04444 [Cyclospora cayetanensis]